MMMVLVVAVLVLETARFVKAATAKTSRSFVTREAPLRGREAGVSTLVEFMSFAGSPWPANSFMNIVPPVLSQ
jgi:hypothetical protein